MATAALALVVRVSRTGGREEKGERFYSPGDQIKDGTKLAEAAGYAVRVYDADLNVSGATPFDERPGMGAALRDLEKGQVAGVVTAARDRLVRQDAAKGVTLASLQERIRNAGGVLIVGDTPDACIGRASDRLVEGFAALPLDILVSMDGRYREEMRKKWRKANGNAIARGVQPGPTPSWLSRGEDGRFAPNEHTPAVVEAVELRAGGASWSDVADLLNARDVPTRDGGPWSYKTAGRLCRCELLIGRVHWGDYRNDSAFEPLVDEATFLLVSSRRERPQGFRDRKPGLATGVATCASCGQRMIQDRTTRKNGSVTDFYRCRSGVCDAPALITHTKLEPFLWGLAFSEVERRVQEEALSASPATNDGPPVAALHESLRTAESEVAGFLLRVKPSTAGYSEALDALEQEVDVAKRRLAVTAAPPQRSILELAEQAERDWSDPAWRRQIVTSVVKQVNITKGRGPVSERIEVVWR